MIAELFYPKELKEIISKLEAEDNLRRDPLNALDREIHLIACVTFFVLILAVSDADFMSSVVFAFLFLATIFFLTKSRTSKFSAFVQCNKKK